MPVPLAAQVVGKLAGKRLDLLRVVLRSNCPRRHGDSGMRRDQTQLLAQRWIGDHLFTMTVTRHSEG
jgi:hypothetical protein